LLLVQSWGDVYYFCGEDFRFCNCEFKWNIHGWGKALTLWNFVLSSALGLQKLAITIGMNGLLPGVYQQAKIMTLICVASKGC